MIDSQIRRRKEKVKKHQPTVALLGLGPSAAYAYRACIDIGITPEVYGMPSPAAVGAFWLHWLPSTVAVVEANGARRGEQNIEMLGIGSSKEYVRKQWGRANIPSSFPECPRLERGFEPLAGLRSLWGQEPESFATLAKLDEATIRGIAGEHDLVIQTFPKWSIPGEETFRTIEFPIAHRTQFRPGSSNVCLYNGSKGPIVRSSYLWSQESHELVIGAETKSWVDAGYTISLRKDISPFTKVVLIEPSAKNIKYLGRYAEQRRKALSFEAYGATMRLIEELLDV